MKTKWMVSLWLLTIIIMVSPVHNALANSGQSEKIEYTKSQLTTTLEQGAKKNPPPPPPPTKNVGDGDEGLFDKAKRFVKKIISCTVDGFKGATKFVEETAFDIMDSASEYWDDRSLFEKSLIIIGTIATVVTLGAAAGVISAGAAVTMGAMGALNLWTLYGYNRQCHVWRRAIVGRNRHGWGCTAPCCKRSKIPSASPCTVQKFLFSVDLGLLYLQRQQEPH